MGSEMGWNAHPPLPPGVAEAMAFKQLQEDRERAAAGAQFGASGHPSATPLSPEDRARMAAENAAAADRQRQMAAERRASREQLLPEFPPEIDATSSNLAPILSRLVRNQRVSIDYEFRSFGRTRSIQGWHFEISHDFWAHDKICWYQGVLITTSGTCIPTKGRHSRVDGPQAGWQPDHSEIAKAVPRQTSAALEPDVAEKIYATVIRWLSRG